MTKFARAALAAALLAGVAGISIATEISAQAIPAGQTCGGLLCDAGIVGTKVAVGPDGRAPTQEQMAAAEAADPHRLPCHDFLCRAFGQKDANAAPPPVAAVAAAPEPVTPVKPTRKAKRKHVAKADAPARTPAPAPAPAAAPDAAK